MTQLSCEVLERVLVAAELIKAAQHALVLTGAGSSTPSGIPDFRSAGSGLWTRFSPMEVASLSVFRYEPEKFYEWLRPLARQMWQANPNPSHYAFADLEKKNYIQTIVTQNIDGLHQRAGSQNVIEVHGTLETLTCIGCFTQFQAAEFLEPYIEQGEIPRCAKCQRILKPDVILFEEQLPVKPWLRAKKESETCDLMIVAGSSLVVTPVASLPMNAVEREVQIIVINQAPTFIDEYSAVVIQGDIAEIVPAIAHVII